MPIKTKKKKTKSTKRINRKGFTETNFKNVLDNMDIGVVIYEVRDEGKKFIFKFFNNAAEIIDGLKEKDVLGKPLSKIFPGVRNPEFGLYANLQSVYKEGKQIITEPRKYHDEKRSGWRQNSIMKLTDNELLVTYRDVTDWVQIQDALEKKVQEQEKLNQVMVERELKMIELKKENEELKKKVNYLRR